MTPSRLLSDGKGSIGAHATYNGRAARAAQRLPCMTRRSMRASCVASATEPRTQMQRWLCCPVPKTRAATHVRGGGEVDPMGPPQALLDERAAPNRPVRVLFSR